MRRDLSARISAYALLLAAWYSVGSGVSGMWGQTQQQDQGPHGVHGTVVNSVTGEPIYRALVQIGGQYAVLTDHEGRFEFEGVTGSSALPFVMKPGYFAENRTPRFLSESSNSSTSNNLSLAPADQTLVLKLVPEAIISGTVIGPDGAPVANISVRLKTLAVQDGLARWRQRAETRTNSEGQYRFAELEAGNYVVTTGFHVEGLAEAESRLGYVPARYPNQSGGSTSADSSIVLNPGDRTVADLNPEIQKLFPVTGSIIGFGESRGVGFRIETASGEEITPLSRFQPRNGEFRLMMPSGSFQITATAYARQGPMEARREVTVAQSPLPGVNFAMEPYASIPVDVEQQAVSQTNDATGASSPQSNFVLNISLTSANGEGFTPFLSAQPVRRNGGDDSALAATGPMSIDNVSPGKYVLRAQPPSPWYVSSAFCGSVDLTREELTIGGASAGCSIRVVLRNDSGSAHVTLRDTPASGLRGIFVYALPEGNLSQQVVMLNQQNGEFAADGIAPGRYLVLALDHQEELPYRDAAAMRRYAGLGQEIAVTPSGKADAELTIASTKVP